MNTYDFYQEITEQFTFPDAPDVGTAKATVMYEWGDVVVAEVAATLVTGNTYSVSVPDELVDSYGTWRIKWACTFATKAFYTYTNFQVERPYTTQAEFMAKYSEFNVSEYQGVNFQKAEKIARGIIDTYTGQNFQYIKNKTLYVDGNGRTSLRVPFRLNWFTNSTIDGDDYTAAIELDPTSKYYVRLLTGEDTIYTKFPSGRHVYITGDWGWVDIPWQVEEAAQLLIADLLDDARREIHRYGIARSWQDTNRIELKNGIFDTTGNIDVDVLIMDFIYWTMDYVT